MAKELKQILGDYLKGTDYKEIDKTISIEKIWKKTVGEPINKNTKIESFKKGTINIRVSNPIWRNELSLQKQSLLEKLKSAQPDLRIREIILK